MGEGGSLMAESRQAKSVKLIGADKLGTWLGALLTDSKVWAPVKVDDQTLFREMSAGDEERLDLDAVRTVNSPKGALLPQTEPLMSYSAKKDAESGEITLAVEPAPEPEPVVLFGVRPCDAAAFELLDKVFLTGEFTDDHYKARREKSAIVAVACPAPDRACFCTSFGLTPGASRGADVVLYGSSGPGPDREGDSYYAVAFTERGEQLLAGGAARAAGMTAAAEDEHDRLDEIISAFTGQTVPLGERLGEVDVVDRLDGLFDSPYWGRVAARCLGCGACTFVCPTCYCFGVADCGGLGEGVRRPQSPAGEGESHEAKVHAQAQLLPPPLR